MAQQDKIKKLMHVHNIRLQALEKRKAMAGPDTPPEILLEIDDIKSKITFLESELEELETKKVKEPPPKIESLYYETKTAVRGFRQTLESLKSELGYISKEAQTRVAYLLEQARQRFLEIEGEWNDLDVQSKAAEKALKTLQSKLSAAETNLRTLILRRNYRRRLSLLEEKLASQQLVLTEEQLQTTLQPQLRQTQEQIQSLETKESLTSHDQNMLNIYRQNLELYQQILAGERPYAPITLLGELIDLEQNLRKIDDELIRAS